jgi:hypothetical protein
MPLPPDLLFLDPLLDVLVDEFLHRLEEREMARQTEADKPLIIGAIV